MPSFRTVRNLWSLVLPINCLRCGLESDWICPDCLSGLPISRPERCHICGKAGGEGLCQKCQKFTHLDGLVSLFDYQLEPIPELIKAIKYRGLTDGLSFIIHYFSSPIEERLPRGRWHLAPTPLSADRMKKRGFNQSELLAQKLSTNRTPIFTGLIRTKFTAPQVELTRKERLVNLKDCFGLITDSTPERLVLVDDVVTTGATLREAARVLRKSGVKSVWGLTIAHG